MNSDRLTQSLTYNAAVASLLHSLYLASNLCVVGLNEEVSGTTTEQQQLLVWGPPLKGLQSKLWPPNPPSCVLNSSKEITGTPGTSGGQVHPP